MKLNLTENGKLILKILAIMLVFYFVVMFIWYSTSPNHRPSSQFYDMRREGYQEDPLHDRWKNGNQ